MNYQDPYASTAGVDVKRLRYFIAVAEELHFGRAAERLNIAQPALSRQIVNLESAIGATLFNRLRNQISLTRAGEILLPSAHDILTRISDAAKLTRRAAKGHTGSISIGFVGSATYSALPTILNSFRKMTPDVDLNLRAMNTAELHTNLVDRRIDAAFARPEINDPEIVNQEVLTEDLVVALPDQEPLTELDELSLSDLATRPFVLYPRNPRPSFADTIIKLCQEDGYSPKVAHETMDLQTALSLVAIGAGVSIVPASVELSQRQGVICRPLEKPVPTTTLSLAYRRDNHSPVLRSFMKVVNDYAKKNKQ